MNDTKNATDDEPTDPPVKRNRGPELPCQASPGAMKAGRTKTGRASTGQALGVGENENRGSALTLPRLHSPDGCHVHGIRSRVGSG
jgi:hypothetical protein